MVGVIYCSRLFCSGIVAGSLRVLQGSNILSCERLHLTARTSPIWLNNIMRAICWFSEGLGRKNLIKPD